MARAYHIKIKQKLFSFQRPLTRKQPKTSKQKIVANSYKTDEMKKK